MKVQVEDKNQKTGNVLLSRTILIPQGMNEPQSEIVIKADSQLNIFHRSVLAFNALPNWETVIFTALPQKNNYKKTNALAGSESKVAC